MRTSALANTFNKGKKYCITTAAAPLGEKDIPTFVLLVKPALVRQLERYETKAKTNYKKKDI